MPDPLPCGCLCGAVRFTVETPLDGLIVCHCRHCQKVSGGAPSYLVAVPRAALKTEGADAAMHSITGDSGKPVHRYFCSACGSPLWSEPEAYPDRAFVKVGAFDRDPGLMPLRSAHTGSAPDWHRIAD